MYLMHVSLEKGAYSSSGNLFLSTILPILIFITAVGGIAAAAYHYLRKKKKQKKKHVRPIKVKPARQPHQKRNRRESSETASTTGTIGLSVKPTTKLKIRNGQNNSLVFGARVNFF